jgi:hypothetical protein
MKIKNIDKYGILAAIIICLVLEWPALHGPFIFDDYPNLKALEHAGFTWRDLVNYLSQARDFPGRPLAMLSFLPQKDSWPDNPYPFKLINIAIHILCGILLFKLATLISEYLKDRNTTSNDNNLAPLIATSAWLLHPMQMSTTMLVVQRMTEMSAFFTISGLLLYITALKSNRASILQRAILMALGLVLCTTMAILSKESGILTPLFALILDLTILRGLAKDLPIMLKWLRRLFIFTPLAFIAIYLLLQLPQYMKMGDYRPFTISERLLSESRILLDYAQKILFPRYGIYSIYHDDYAISTGPFSPLSTAFSLLAILFAATFSWLVRKRAPLASFGIAWFLGGHLIESTVVPLELYFEHRNYLPMFGPIFSLSTLAAQQWQTVRKPIVLVGVLAWFGSCLTATLLTARAWGNADFLASTWAKENPSSIRAAHFLAERLYERREPSEALKVIQNSRKLHPNSSEVALAEAFLLCINNQFTQDSYEDLAKILSMAKMERGGFEYISNLLDLTLTKKCQNTLTPASWLNLTELLIKNPSYHQYSVAMGYIHYQRHRLAVTQGRLDIAIRELDMANEADPTAEIPRLEASYLASAGLYDQAIDTLRRADYDHLPLMRRILVNDKEINAEVIRSIQWKEAGSLKKKTSS